MVTAAVLVASTAISAAGLVKAWRSPVQSSGGFERASFHHRVAELDLDALTESEIDELVRLLERDVTQGRLWLPAELEARQAAAFHRNFDALAARWASRKAAEFAQVPPELRDEYIRRNASAVRRVLRAENYLDLRGLALLAGREPPLAITDLPRGWVREEMQRWERAAPRDQRSEVRHFAQAMERQALRRTRRPGDD